MEAQRETFESRAQVVVDDLGSVDFLVVRVVVVRVFARFGQLRLDLLLHFLDFLHFRLLSIHDLKVLYFLAVL